MNLLVIVCVLASKMIGISDSTQFFFIWFYLWFQSWNFSRSARYNRWKKLRKDMTKKALRFNFNQKATTRSWRCTCMYIYNILHINQNKYTYISYTYFTYIQVHIVMCRFKMYVFLLSETNQQQCCTQKQAFFHKLCRPFPLNQFSTTWPESKRVGSCFCNIPKNP